MNIEEFAKLMKILGTIYNKDFSQDEVKIWYSFFQETNSEDLKIAIKRVGEKEKFCPSIARLKEEISTFTNPELQLDVDEEWNKVRYCIRTYGPYKEKEAMEYLNPFTRKIVEGMGYQRLMTIPSDEMQYEYKRFKDSFMSYSKTLNQTNSLSSGVRTLIENKRMEQLSLHDKEALNLIGEHYD